MISHIVGVIPLIDSPNADRCAGPWQQGNVGRLVDGLDRPDEESENIIEATCTISRWLMSSSSLLQA